jgi:hypothetical protein
MTTDQWLVVGLIISNFVAPIVAERIKPSISKPKAAPETNDPKKRTRRFPGWLIRLGTSPWILPPIGILYDIGVLVWVGRSSTAVTRGVVLMIASAVAGIVWNAVNMNALVSANNATTWTEIVSKMADTQSLMAESQSTQTDVLGKLSKSIELIVERINKIEHRLDILDASMKPGIEIAEVSEQSAPDKTTLAVAKFLTAVKTLLGF